MLRCAVVDDEPLAVKMIENFISKTDFLEHAGSWNDPVEALSRIADIKPDLVFLDIQMPDLDGLQLASMLPEETKVIFTTAFKEYAFDSYGVAALDFLLKPVRYQRFLESATKAKEWFEMRNASASRTVVDDGSIFVKSDGSLVKVIKKDILFIEGMKDYVVFHVAPGRQVVTHLTMKAAEEMLSGGDFQRVHRSYIVNLSRIDSVTSTGDLVIGERSIHVSDAYQDVLNEFLTSRLLVK